MRKKRGSEDEFAQLLSQDVNKSKLPSLPDQPKFQKSRQHTFLIAVLPIIVLFFTALLFVQQQRIEDMRDGQQALLEQLAELRAQNKFYKTAYEVTLDDIRVLSMVYGGEEQYESLANELRDEEIGMVVGNVSERTYELRNIRMWGEYTEKGIINTSCLGTPLEADTIQDEVLFAIGFESDGADVSLYIDGNLLATHTVDGSADVQFRINLPQGEHEFDALVKEGTARITSFSIDAIIVPGDSLVFDSGASIRSFDCKDTARETGGLGPGAIRLRFAKH